MRPGVLEDAALAELIQMRPSLIGTAKTLLTSRCLTVPEAKTHVALSSDREARASPLDAEQLGKVEQEGKLPSIAKLLSGITEQSVYMRNMADCIYSHLQDTSATANRVQEKTNKPVLENGKFY